MAHNAKKRSRYLPNPDDAEYDYKPPKIRENKTRDRRYDANVIKAGLLDYEDPGSTYDSIDEEDIIDDYYDMMNTFNDIIEDTTDCSLHSDYVMEEDPYDVFDPFESDFYDSALDEDY